MSFRGLNKIPSDVYSCLFCVITSTDEEIIDSLAATVICHDTL